MTAAQVAEATVRMAAEGRVPFRAVVLYGFIAARAGENMTWGSNQKLAAAELGIDQGYVSRLLRVLVSAGYLRPVRTAAGRAYQVLAPAAGPAKMRRPAAYSRAG